LRYNAVMMWILSQEETSFNFAQFLADASSPVLLGIFVIALLRRWIILPRELDSARADIDELKRERDEYKNLAIRALSVGERVTNVVEKG
jgi:hypothetical protein